MTSVIRVGVDGRALEAGGRTKTHRCVIELLRAAARQEPPGSAEVLKTSGIFRLAR